MPTCDKTSTCCTLSEVLRMDDGHIVKEEQLRRETSNVTKGIFKYDACYNIKQLQHVSLKAVSTFILSPQVAHKESNKKMG